ncbi:MAG: hypothetical protein ACKPKO_44755, partial [Candidatus Fonsibacter sp.]
VLVARNMWKQVGKGQRRQYLFGNWSDREVRDEFDSAGAQLGAITFTMQEGKLTSGRQLVRPHSGRPMFVGAVLSGFRGYWITEGSCYVCASPHGTAQCSK